MACLNLRLVVCETTIHNSKKNLCVSLHNHKITTSCTKSRLITKQYSAIKCHHQCTFRVVGLKDGHIHKHSGILDAAESQWRRSVYQPWSHLWIWASGHLLLSMQIIKTPYTCIYFMNTLCLLSRSLVAHRLGSGSTYHVADWLAPWVRFKTLGLRAEDIIGEENTISLCMNIVFH